MAEITTQPDGSASITVSSAETAGLKGLAAQHLPFLRKAEAWFSADIAPELKDAADFLDYLAGKEVQGDTLAVTASQMKTLQGVLSAHVPDFRQILAVVESPAVRALFNLAKALL